MEPTYVFTLKGPTTGDPWVVIRCNSLEDARAVAAEFGVTTTEDDTVQSITWTLQEAFLAAKGGGPVRSVGERKKSRKKATEPVPDPVEVVEDEPAAPAEPDTVEDDLPGLIEACETLKDLATLYRKNSSRWMPEHSELAKAHKKTLADK